MSVYIKILIALTCFAPLTALAVDIYKYKDEKGDWVFGDKKPIVESEKIKVNVAEKIVIQPEIFTERTNENDVLRIKNPFHAPVEIVVQSRVFETGRLHGVIAADTIETLYDEKGDFSDAQLYWMLGDPAARHDGTAYQIPSNSYAKHQITQSFNGRFSHSEVPNIYAVDLEMAVGTYITAARAGTVIYVKDDYYHSGQKEYFADKANVVVLLHDDGTYASYAHLLGGTALVKPGDVVQAGTSLARSGSSGFSSGPHLHFVVRRNAGMKPISIPFEFIDKRGDRFVPKAGMFVDGSK